MVDQEGKVITDQEAEGILTINYPWPGIARTIYGNHERYKETYFSAFEGRYFLETVLYVMLKGIIESQVALMMLLLFLATI